MATPRPRSSGTVDVSHLADLMKSCATLATKPRHDSGAKTVESADFSFTVLDARLDRPAGMALVKRLTAGSGLAQCRHIVDIRPLRQIDSRQAGVLIDSLRRLGHNGCRVAVVAATRSLAPLFAVAGVDRYAALCDDFTDALAFVAREPCRMPKIRTLA